MTDEAEPPEGDRRAFLSGVGSLLAMGVVSDASRAATNSPPTAKINYYPEEPSAGEEVRFTGIVSEDSDGEITEYYWEIEESETSLRTEYSYEIRQTWDVGGTYDLTLTVTDDGGKTDSTTVTIEVASTAPTADFAIDPLSPKPRQEVTLDGTKSTDPNDSIDDYEWKIEETDGSLETASGEKITRTWPSEDTYDVSLTVTDREGKTDTVTKSITVYDESPKPSITTDSERVKTGKIVTINASESSDPDGTIVSYSWEVTYYNYETKSFTGETIHTWWEKPGTFPVELTVTDDGGKERSTTTEITVENRAPIAKFNVETWYPTQNRPVRFNGGSSVDAEGQIETYNWSVQTDTGEANYSGRTFEHTFDTAGKYAVTLVVEDDHGARDRITKTVDVAPQQRTTPTTAPTTVSPSTVVSSTTTTIPPTSPTPAGVETTVVESGRVTDATLAVSETTVPTRTPSNSSVAAGWLDKGSGSGLAKLLGGVSVGAVGLYGLHRLAGGSSTATSESAGGSSGDTAGSEPSTESGGTDSLNLSETTAENLRDDGISLLTSATLLAPADTRRKLTEARESLREAVRTYEALERKKEVHSLEGKIEEIDSKLSVLPDVLESLDVVDDGILSESMNLDRLTQQELQKNSVALEQAIDAASAGGFAVANLESRVEAIEEELDERTQRPASREELVDEIDRVAAELGQIPAREEVVDRSDIDEQRFDDEFDTWESALEATNVVERRQEQAQERIERIEQAIASDEFEKARDVISTLQDQLDEAPEYVSLGLSQDDIRDLRHRLKERVSEQLSTLVQSAKSKAKACSSHLESGRYEKAKQSAREGIEACQEAAELGDEYSVDYDGDISDVESNLVSTLERTDTIDSLSEAAEDNLGRADEALQSNDYETVESQIDALESNLDELRALDASQHTISRFEAGGAELEESLAEQRAEQSFVGLLGAIGAAISKAGHLLDSGSYERAVHRLDSASDSLEKARQLNEQHELGREESLSEKRAVVATLTEQAKERPTEEVVKALEDAEAAVSDGITHRDGDRPAEAVESFETAQKRYQSALELASEYDVPQAWEISQRLSMVEEYREISEDALDERRTHIKDQLQGLLDEAESALRTAKQHEEVGDYVSARETTDTVSGQLDEAKRLLETELGAARSRERYRELKAEVERFERRLPESDDTSSYRTRDLVESLQEMATHIGESPRPEFVNAYGEHPAEAYLTEFGSWPEALAAANLDPIDEDVRERRTYTRVEVLDALKEVAEEIGRPPTKGDMIDYGSMSASPIESRFTDWETALRCAGIAETERESESAETERAELPEGAPSSNGDGDSDRKGVIRTGAETDRAAQEREDDVAVTEEDSSTEESTETGSPTPEDLCAALRRLDEETEGYPLTTEIRETGAYEPEDFYDEFGSWDDALQAAGIDKEQRLIDDIHRVNEIVEGVPSTVDMNEYGHHSSGTHSGTFGSWAAALEAAGLAEQAANDLKESGEEEQTSTGSLTSEDSTPGAVVDTLPEEDPSREDYLEAIHRVASATEKPVKSTDVSDESPYGVQEFTREFGSWQDALEAADVDNESRLIGELRRVADELGHRPSTTEMNSHGHVSAGYFTDYFGTYSAAVEQAFGDVTASDPDSSNIPVSNGSTLGRESTTSQNTNPSTSTTKPPSKNSTTQSQGAHQERPDTDPQRAALIREMENLNDRWSNVNRKLIYSVSDYDPEDFKKEFGSVDAAIEATGLDDTDQADEDSTSEKTQSETDSPPESESSLEAEELLEELRELDEEWSKIDRKLLYSVGQYHPDEYEETFGSLEAALAKAGVNDKEATEESTPESCSDGVAGDEQPKTSSGTSSESVPLDDFATLGDLTPNRRTSKELAIKIADELYAGAKKDAAFEVTDSTGETVRFNLWSKHDLKIPEISDDWIVIENIRLQEWEKGGETNRNLSSTQDTVWRMLDQIESSTNQQTPESKSAQSDTGSTRSTSPESTSGELQEVNGVTDAIEQSLRGFGFHSRDDLKKASLEDIAEADGVSEQVAMRIKLDVGG